MVTGSHFSAHPDSIPHKSNTLIIGKQASMCEIGDEHPGGRIPDAGKEGHGEHKTPSLAEGTSQRVGAEQPHERPQGKDKRVVFDSSWNPLAPEPKSLNTSY